MNNIFQALSSTIRRKILAYLSETSLTAGQIAERFNISKPALSKHLSILQNAGLIKSEKNGQYVHYHLIKEHLLCSLNNFLATFCPVSRSLKRESAEIAVNKNNED